MRHRKSGRKLKRTASHRKALLSALSTSLLRHRRIRTTTAKAKEAQRFVEGLISKAKRALAHESKDKTKAVHARRVVSRY
ncbi:MAG: L17 family ribosomal protein, partial [Bacteroidota bacterium]